MDKQWEYRGHTFWLPLDLLEQVARGGIEGFVCYHTEEVEGRCTLCGRLTRRERRLRKNKRR